MTKETIQVEGMSCEHCKDAVESSLAKLNGVHTAEVNLNENMFALYTTIQKSTLLK